MAIFAKGTTWIFHHIDADGISAAHVVLLHLKKTGGINETKLYPINYGYKFPIEEIKSSDTVYIVDYSIEPEEMKKLQEIIPDYNRIIWIDHHKSAIEKYNGFGEIKGIREEDKRSGVMLAWNFLINDCPPLYVQLICDYDVWSLESKYAIEFQDAFMAYFKDPNHEDLWAMDGEFGETFPEVDLGYKSITNEYIQKGIIIGKYKTQLYNQFIKNAYETTIDGYKAIALNLKMNKMQFDSLNKKYDVYIAYIHDGKTYNVSLYSDTVDTTEISMKYGGGGHPGASGFSCDTLPFTRSEE